MKYQKILIAILLMFDFFIVYSQNEKEDWILFRDDKNEELKGYKDILGNVKIEPKFTFLTNSIVFKNIIPVFEKVNIDENQDYEMSQYYLLKSGKKVGIDSLYVFDFTLDCEREDKIRFRDRKTDKVGFFDSNGNVIIPAKYNDARKFNNGFAIVVKDAKRICYEGGEYSKENQCEHWSWKGNYQLINSKNEVILDSLEVSKFNDIDWYSLKINPKEANINNIEFIGLDGNLYSFSNNKNEFEFWFHSVFIKKTNKVEFLNNCFENITISKSKNLKSKEFKNSKYSDYAWVIDIKEKFYDNNKNYILKIIEVIKSNKLNIDISNGFGPILFEYETNKMYYDDCGEYENEKYPYFEVVITNKDFHVMHLLGFIKTKTGYKLVVIS